MDYWNSTSNSLNGQTSKGSESCLQCLPYAQRRPCYTPCPLTPLAASLFACMTRSPHWATTVEVTSKHTFLSYWCLTTRLTVGLFVVFYARRIEFTPDGKMRSTNSIIIIIIKYKPPHYLINLYPPAFPECWSEPLLAPLAGAKVSLLGLVSPSAALPLLSVFACCCLGIAQALGVDWWSALLWAGFHQTCINIIEAKLDNAFFHCITKFGWITSRFFRKSYWLYFQTLHLNLSTLYYECQLTKAINSKKHKKITFLKSDKSDSYFPAETGLLKSRVLRIPRSVMESSAKSLPWCEMTPNELADSNILSSCFSSFTSAFTDIKSHT